MEYSIIIPTFNSGKTLKRCLDSIVTQSFHDWEVMAMDGDSKDDTVEIVRSYHDERIHVFSETDKGIYDAMNKGIDKSTGKWLLFLGCDDYLYDKEVLSNVAPYLLDELDVVYGEVESNLPEVHKGEWSLELIEANRCHQAIFYNRHFFGQSLRYNLRYPVLADFDINLRWFLNKHYKHRYIPVVISHYSTGGVSSFSKDEMFLKEVGLNKLRYNHRMLNPLYKKRAARQYVNANPDKLVLNIFLILYADAMWLIQKIMNTDQKK